MNYRPIPVWFLCPRCGHKWAGEATLAIADGPYWSATEFCYACSDDEPSSEADQAVGEVVDLR